MREWVISLLARVVVVLILSGCAVVVHVARVVRRALGLRECQTRDGKQRLLLTGTFYNLGWYRSHVIPLTKCERISEIIVVCDTPLFAADKVTYACPPRWLRRCLGGKGARLVWVGCVAWSKRPRMLMGYHIMPNALICLAVARCVGAEVIYQMTGGPIQIIGGGVGSENFLLNRQGKPSRLREGLMFHLVRQFDWVIVRGQKAVEFLNDNRLARRCLIIPGSVDCERFAPNGVAKTYDLVTVGRLVVVKRLDLLLEMVAQLARQRPAVRVAVVGDGPLKEELQRRAKTLGIESCVDYLGQREDVAAVLRQSRAFVLASENEGLSIAMLEAMAAGLPAIVPDVGDLADVVNEDRTGLLVDPTDPRQSAGKVGALLADDKRLTQLSQNARARAVDYSGIDAVVRRWDAVFAGNVEKGEEGVGPALKPVM